MFDIVAASIGFLLLSPLFVLIMVLLYISNKGKPFFLQMRPGKNEKVFKIIKFKTMTDAKGVNGELLPDEDRITQVGSLVRKSSLDEIPQLLNVIKGDMSLIGPRPLIIEYLPLYNKEQSKRHSVKPGITGWAQVNGRNAISWTKKFELDVEYVNNISLYFDLRIVFMTVKKVFKREGINSDNHATMEMFTGTN